MGSFSIAFKLFKTNARAYGYYLAVMIFAVFVYYDFTMLKHNPQVLKAQEFYMQARAAAQITSFVLLVILVFFAWYSSSFFLKQRKKEIGLYLMAGVSNAKIGLVFAIESIFTGIVAVGAGLALGILFSKLFIMAVAKVALLKVTVSFSVPFAAVYEVIVTFGIIYMAISIRNFASIVKSRLIDLISGTKKEEGIPGFKLAKGILSLILIGSGYYLSIWVFKSGSSMSLPLLVVVLVVLGTYWFFGAFLSMAMLFLINRKGIMYRGVRLISISNVVFRIKANYRSLATLAVMAAVTITAFGTSLSLKYYVDTTHDIQFPYSFSYISSDSALNQRVTEIIENSGHKLLLKERVNFLRLKPVKIEGSPSAASDKLAVKLSDFIRITRELNAKNADEVIECANLAEDQVLYVEAPGVIASLFSYEGKKIPIGGKDYVIAMSKKMPLFGEGPLVGHMPCLIISDAAYENLKTLYEEQVFNGFVVDNAENSMDLALKLYGAVPQENGLFAYAAEYYRKYSYIGLFFFLGAFMSVVFILATGSIMYFKILSEALADKEKYEILEKIGMTSKEIRKAISGQVGLSLILPLFVGIVHSMFAINVLKRILNYDLVVPTLAAIAVFSLCYGVFYVATTNKFLRLVSLRMGE